jgi:hypothetical protein
MSKVTAEKNLRLLEEMVEMVSPGYLEVAKNNIKEMFIVGRLVSGFEKLEFIRRFEKRSTTKFVARRESGATRILRNKWL